MPSVGYYFRTEKAYVRGLAGGAFSICQIGDNEMSNN